MSSDDKKKPYLRVIARLRRMAKEASAGESLVGEINALKNRVENTGAVEWHLSHLDEQVSNELTRLTIKVRTLQLNKTTLDERRAVAEMWAIVIIVAGIFIGAFHYTLGYQQSSVLPWAIYVQKIILSFIMGITCFPIPTVVAVILFRKLYRPWMQLVGKLEAFEFDPDTGCLFAWLTFPIYSIALMFLVFGFAFLFLGLWAFVPWIAYSFVYPWLLPSLITLIKGIAQFDFTSLWKGTAYIIMSVIATYLTIAQVIIPTIVKVFKHFTKKKEKTEA